MDIFKELPDDLGIRNVHKYILKVDADEAKEAVAWIEENLTEVCGLLYHTGYCKLVVQTTNDDDLAILVLRYGMAAKSSFF